MTNFDGRWVTEIGVPAFDLPSHIGLAASGVTVAVKASTGLGNSVGRHACYPALSGCRVIRRMSV